MGRGAWQKLADDLAEGMSPAQVATGQGWISPDKAAVEWNHGKGSLSWSQTPATRTRSSALKQVTAQDITEKHMGERLH